MNAQFFHLSYARVDNEKEWTGYGINSVIRDEFRTAWKLFRSQLNAHGGEEQMTFAAEIEQQIRLRHETDKDGVFRELDLT